MHIPTAAAFSALLASSLVSAATLPSPHNLFSPRTDLGLSVDVCAYIDVKIQLIDLLGLLDLSIDIAACLCLDVLVEFCDQQQQKHRLSNAQRSNLLSQLSSKVSRNVPLPFLLQDAHHYYARPCRSNTLQRARRAPIHPPAHPPAPSPTRAITTVLLARSLGPIGGATQPACAPTPTTGSATASAFPSASLAPAQLPRSDVSISPRSHTAPGVSPCAAFTSKVARLGSALIRSPILRAVRLNRLPRPCPSD